MRPIELVLSRLEGVKRSGDGWTARCPAHDDRAPSLSVDEGDDERVLLTCFAGCETAAIVAAVDLTLADLFPPSENGRGGELGEPEAVYPYVDEGGALLFEVVRFPSKRFLQRRPDPGSPGGYAWRLGDVRRVLYRADRLLDAREQEPTTTVYIVEGEKDVHALEQAGVLATCNPGGAGKWRPEYSEQLGGFYHVVVIADRDEPGRKHARAVATALDDVVDQVELVEPAEGKDASDHLVAGLTLEQLVELQPNEESRTAAVAKPFPALDLDLFLASPPSEPPWDWHGWYAAGDLVLAAGDPGVGKSMVLLAAAITSAKGGGDLLGEAVSGRRVTFFDLESPEDVVYLRLWGFGVRGRLDGFEYVHRPPGFNLLDSEGIARVRASIVASRSKLVVVDSLRRAAPGLDENDSREVSILLTALRDTAAELGCTIVVVHHPRKPVGEAKVEALYAARGSGDLIGSVDSYLFFRKLAGGLIRIEHGKARRGREHESVCYRITEGEDGEPRLDLVDVEGEEGNEAALLEMRARVRTFVHEHPGCSQNAVEKGVDGRATLKRRALDLEVADGYIEDRGAGNRKAFHTVETPSESASREELEWR